MCRSVYSYILFIRHYAQNTFSTLPNLTNQWIMVRILRRNRTYLDSLRMAKNRQIPNIRNILGLSRINWRVIARTDFCIGYSPIFVFSENLEGLKIYSTHNEEYREYTHTLIRTLLVCLFLPNILWYSSRMYECAVPPLVNTYVKNQFLPLLVNLCENIRECRRIFGTRPFSAILWELT